MHCFFPLFSVFPLRNPCGPNLRPCSLHYCNLPPLAPHVASSRPWSMCEIPQTLYACDHCGSSWAITELRGVVIAWCRLVDGRCWWAWALRLRVMWLVTLTVMCDVWRTAKWVTVQWQDANAWHAQWWRWQSVTSLSHVSGISISSAWTPGNPCPVQVQGLPGIAGLVLAKCVEVQAQSRHSPGPFWLGLPAKPWYVEIQGQSRHSARTPHGLHEDYVGECKDLHLHLVFVKFFL